MGEEIGADPALIEEPEAGAVGEGFEAEGAKGRHAFAADGLACGELDQVIRKASLEKGCGEGAATFAEDAGEALVCEPSEAVSQVEMTFCFGDLQQARMGGFP